MSSGVAKRYARALFEVAKERGLIEQIESELKDIVAAVESNQELGKILTHNQISIESKEQLLKDLFGAHVAAETLNFLSVLIDNGREHELGEIATAYVAMANEARGVADAVVTTAKPLGEEEVNELAAQFGKKVNKTLRVQTVVDPAILGGVVVRIGDRLYDGSIKRKLEQFAHQ
ncbi:F0F1 ATP synthase subunit delta [Brevibacillus fluminis]|uniref:ATP synthase subunit delta n=1 Tax=Brevibacillus fluminis TaxID=511487 RepID=A0A3M8D1U3_9BACL|nr:F0F1 ATP synthase subunit delta [Brevibacillus fluminis]RNB82044.1 F0F1 ATP synthase subunit delta [Brevibacillus fluminis]